MSVAPFYTLVTEDGFLASEWIQSIQAKLPKETTLTKIDMSKVSVAQLLDTFNTYSMFDPHRLFVVKQAKELPEKDQGQLIDYLKNMADQTYVIWHVPKVDKRKSFYKTLKKETDWVELQTPKKPQMRSWIQRWLSREQITMAPSAISLLVDFVGNDVGRSYQELDKIALYIYPRQNITEQDIQIMVLKLSGEDVFACTDAIVEQQPKRALESMHYLFDQGVHALALISMLSRHIRILLKTASAQNQNVPHKQMASYIGIPPFTLKRYQLQRQRFSPERCHKALDLLSRLDKEMKSGLSDKAQLLLEKTVIHMCSL